MKASLPADKHIDHIGIAVDDLESAIKTYEKLLGTACYKRETVEEQHVETAFFKTGESKIELLAATSPQSVIRKYIEKRGEGMHHVAYEVPDIKAEMERLRNQNFTFLSEEPSRGADDKWVVFVHPSDGRGVLSELCQSR